MALISGFLIWFASSLHPMPDFEFLVRGSSHIKSCLFRKCFAFIFTSDSFIFCLNVEKLQVLCLVGALLPEPTVVKMNGLSAPSSFEQLSVWLAAEQPG